jgi:hypothetical protein
LEDRKTEKLADGVVSFQLSADGQKMLLAVSSRKPDAPPIRTTIAELKAHPVIGWGSIERRHRKIVQPEIDAQLSAVMDLMVEKHGTKQL